MLKEMVSKFRLRKMQSLGGSEMKLLDSGRSKKSEKAPKIQIILGDNEFDKY